MTIERVLNTCDDIEADVMYEIKMINSNKR